jgi:hypothetical protein
MGAPVQRHFRRLYGAYEEDGPEAILDRRRGRPAANKAPEKVADWVEAQYRACYFDFSAKHFHEALVKAHPTFRYGYTWTKSVLYLRGCLKPTAKRGPHRMRRERSAMAGMLVFQDGSEHDWFCGRRAPCDLIVTLDDATGAILSAFFVEEEGTASSFRGLRETIERHGHGGRSWTWRAGTSFLGRTRRRDWTSASARRRRCRRRSSWILGGIWGEGHRRRMAARSKKFPTDDRFSPPGLGMAHLD